MGISFLRLLACRKKPQLMHLGRWLEMIVQENKQDNVYDKGKVNNREAEALL